MKKIIVVLCLFFMSNLAANAGYVEVFDYSNMNMKNLWNLNGKYEEKVLDVGAKLISANKLDKRVTFQTNRSTTTINANTSKSDKVVTIYYGLLPYIDNDDELAAILSHEMCHAMDSYGGFLKWIDMDFNSKEYEYKADLVGIDYMVNAGYNPIAAICVMNKVGPESYWDIAFLTTHPKTSKRLLAMYKYIYVKYPWALKTDMVNDVNYQNFMNSSQNEINLFLQHEKERAAIQHREDL